MNMSTRLLLAAPLERALLKGQRTELVGFDRATAANESM